MWKLGSAMEMWWYCSSCVDHNYKLYVSVEWIIICTILLAGLPTSEQLINPTYEQLN